MGNLVLFPGMQDMNKPVTQQRRPAIIELLQEELAAAEQGKLQAIAIVSVYSDDEEATIGWLPNPVPSRDYQKLVTGISVLLHQLAALVPHPINDDDEDVA
jgi:hypothetical protein